MEKQTHLERLVAETIRPALGALILLQQEIAETLDIPTAPWKILNKPYNELTEQEIIALMDIYHIEGETEPCSMCSWMARVELERFRKDKEAFGA